MRDHSECERAYQDALAADKPGEAEWILTRCDRSHGHLSTETPVRAALGVQHAETEERQP